MQRRKKQPRIIPPSKTRAELEREHGRTWDVQELAHDFVITSIIGTTVVVRRKSDGVVGTLSYQSNPSLYFNFIPAPPTE